MLNALFKPLILIFVCLFLTVGLAYGQVEKKVKNKPKTKAQKKTFYISLDAEEKKNPFVFELFFLTSGYDYQKEIATEIPLLRGGSEIGNSVGLSIINHFGLGMAFGLKSPIKNTLWYHSGHITIELAGTSFAFQNDPSLFLSFRHYALAYRHRFHFLTKVNHFLLFVGGLASVNFSIISIDNINNFTTEPFSSLNIKFPFSIELGLSYKDFQTWFDLSYGKTGRIDNSFGIAFYLGFRV